MNFLYPQLLYGLFALSIPIIFHLFNFRRTKKVYFSNTQLLKRVKEVSSAKRKLKHYLILASRLLMLLFLILAFAQPFIPSGQDEEVNNKAVVYLDNSWSMMNEVDEELTALDAALTYLNELINILPSSVEYKLLTNDFDSYSSTYKSKSDLADLLTEVEHSGTIRTIDEISGRLTSMQNEPFDVYWISDFQSSTTGSREVEFDSALNINIVPLRFNSYSNVYIDSVYLDNPFLIGDEKLKLNLVVGNLGESNVTDLIVKVFVDDVQSATASINIGPNDKSLTIFDLAFNLNQSNNCRISFEEFPVAFDNDFYFTIKSGQKIDILEVKGNETLPHIESVYGNQQLFNITSFDYTNLDYSLISGTDLLILNELQSIDASLSTMINEYLNNNGSLVVIPAQDPDVASYRQISQIAAISVTDTLSKSSFDTPDFGNPFFEDVFQETEKRFSMPEGTNVITWGQDRSAILKYKNGLPYLSHIGGKGNIFLFGSPLNLDYTNLQTHALFVPIMYRIASQSATDDTGLYYFIDDPYIDLKMDSINSESIFKLTRASEEIIPGQRVMGNQVYIETPKYALKSGFYNLIHEDEPKASLAFNNSSRESVLEQLENEEIKRLIKGNIDILEATDKMEFINKIEKKYVGQPLWKYAVILTLFFLLAEVLIIRFIPN